MKRFRFALALALVAACAPPKPPPGAAGPGEAVREFSEAVRSGNAPVAWSLLSARTQREADELAARARAAARGSGPANGQQMLFTAAQPGPPVEVHLVSQAGDAAVVEVTPGPDGARKFHVVREEGRWRVELPLASDGGASR